MHKSSWNRPSYQRGDLKATALTFESASTDCWFYGGDNCRLCNANEALYSQERICCVFGCVYVRHTMRALSLLLSVLSQVMRETDTQVKWPSKLKIGAKSKKGDKSLLCFSHCFMSVFLLLPQLISRWFPMNIHPSIQFLLIKIKILFSRSTCEGRGEEKQCFGSQKKDTWSAGNKGEVSGTWFLQFFCTFMTGEHVLRWSSLLYFVCFCLPSWCPPALICNVNLKMMPLLNPGKQGNSKDGCALYRALTCDWERWWEHQKGDGGHVLSHPFPWLQPPQCYWREKQPGDPTWDSLATMLLHLQLRNWMQPYFSTFTRSPLLGLLKEWKMPGGGSEWVVKSIIWAVAI